MDPSTPIKARLESLRISQDQRPASRGTGAGGAGNGGRGGPGRRRRSGGRKVAVLLIVGALAVAGYLKRDAILQWTHPSVQAAEFKWVTVMPRVTQSATPILTATGKIVSDHKVQVTTKVSGQIVALYFEQGDRVDKGQRLASIEDVLYRARRDEAAAQLEKSRASLEFQAYNLDRLLRLQQQNTTAEVEVAEARRAKLEAAAQVKANEAALRQTQKSLDDCQVVAPIAGVILERNVEVGDFVAAEGGLGANANAQFGLIADMTVLRVEVDVSELDIHRLSADIPCVITPDAYKDHKYHGRVMWIDPGANYSKATVQVKVRVDDPDDRLRVDGSAQVVFLSEPTMSSTTFPTTSEPTIASQPSDAASDSAPAANSVASVTVDGGNLWIPVSACQFDTTGGNTARVFVLAEGQLHETIIQVGRRESGQVEVLAGLRAGQTIAGDGLERLRNGQRVRS